MQVRVDRDRAGRQAARHGQDARAREQIPQPLERRRAAAATTRRRRRTGTRCRRVRCALRAVEVVPQRLGDARATHLRAACARGIDPLDAGERERAGRARDRERVPSPQTASRRRQRGPRCAAASTGAAARIGGVHAVAVGEHRDARASATTLGSREIGEDLAGIDRGELVRVADQHRAVRVAGSASSSASISSRSIIEASSTSSAPTGSGLLRVVREAVAAIAEQAVQRLRDRRRAASARSVSLGSRERCELRGDHLGQPVRGLAGLRGERDLGPMPEPREPADDRRGDERLAGARPAGDDGELAAERELDRARACSADSATRCRLPTQRGDRAPRLAVDRARSARKPRARAARRRAARAIASARCTGNRSSTISGNRASPMPITELNRGAAVSCVIRFMMCAAMPSRCPARRRMLADELAELALRADRAATASSPGAARSSARARGCERLGIAAAEPAIGGDELLGEVEAFVTEVAAARADAEPAEHVVRRHVARTARAACRVDAASSCGHLASAGREPVVQLASLTSSTRTGTTTPWRTNANNRPASWREPRSRSAAIA